MMKIHFLLVISVHDLQYAVEKVAADHPHSRQQIKWQILFLLTIQSAFRLSGELSNSWLYFLYSLRSSARTGIWGEHGLVLMKDFNHLTTEWAVAKQPRRLGISDEIQVCNDIVSLSV